jgi:hypothetical protein
MDDGRMHGGHGAGYGGGIGVDETFIGRSVGYRREQ